eukprot:649381-Prymnesium_polylepis.1
MPMPMVRRSCVTKRRLPGAPSAAERAPMLRGGGSCPPLVSASVINAFVKTSLGGPPRLAA